LRHERMRARIDVNRVPALDICRQSNKGIMGWVGISRNEIIIQTLCSGGERVNNVVDIARGDAALDLRHVRDKLSGSPNYHDRFQNQRWIDGGKPKPSLNQSYFLA
jgi:hypothetical protein